MCGWGQTALVAGYNLRQTSQFCFGLKLFVLRFVARLGVPAVAQGSQRHSSYGVLHGRTAPSSTHTGSHWNPSWCELRGCGVWGNYIKCSTSAVAVTPLYHRHTLSHKTSLLGGKDSLKIIHTLYSASAVLSKNLYLRKALFSWSNASHFVTICHPLSLHS